MSIREILEDADKPLGNTKQQMDELEAALTAYVEEECRLARVDELRRNRRWFEKMAEYADVKEDAMAEYDDRIAELEQQ